MGTTRVWGADGIPHVVERLKVMVGRGVTAGLMPDALLSVVVATEAHYLAPILGTAS